MIFYANGNVTVDRDFVRFGAKSYAIRQINSVEVRSEPPPKSKAVWWAVLAGGLALLGIVTVMIPLVILGAILGVVAWQTSRKKRTSLHHLLLHTSSSEVQAYETRDDDDIVQLRTAIEAAMAGRAPA